MQFGWAALRAAAYGGRTRAALVIGSAPATRVHAHRHQFTRRAGSASCSAAAVAGLPPRSPLLALGLPRALHVNRFGPVRYPPRGWTSRLTPGVRVLGTSMPPILVRLLFHCFPVVHELAGRKRNGERGFVGTRVHLVARRSHFDGNLAIGSR